MQSRREGFLEGVMLDAEIEGRIFKGKQEKVDAPSGWGPGLWVRSRSVGSLYVGGTRVWAGAEEGWSHRAARLKPGALSRRCQELWKGCELERVVDREVVMMGGGGGRRIVVRNQRALGATDEVHLSALGWARPRPGEEMGDLGGAGLGDGPGLSVSRLGVSRERPREETVYM